MKLTQTTKQFPVIIEQDPSGGYVVECPLFEGCFSQGETIENALTNIKEAITLCLEDQDVELMPQNVSMHLVSVKV